jgi:hypothetical protein
MTQVEWMMGLPPFDGAIPPEVWLARGPDDLLCLVDAHRYPRRVITGPDNSAYLTRYAVSTPKEGAHIYLHEIHRADADHELHDHPWQFAAYILHGGYVEQRWQDGARVEVQRHLRTSYTMDEHTFHRIDRLLTTTCWTLVVTGPRVKSWSFWDPEKDVVTPWRTFVNGR